MERIDPPQQPVYGPPPPDVEYVVDTLGRSWFFDGQEFYPVDHRLWDGLG